MDRIFKNFSRFLTCWIPISSFRRRLREYIYGGMHIVWLLFKSSKKLVSIKLKKNKIKVAFLHMYSTSSQAYSLFEKMLVSNLYDPYWIVNLDISRGDEHAFHHYNITRQYLIKQYGKERVLDGYDIDNKKFIDYTNDFVLSTTTNPYDVMAHELFKIRYWSKKTLMFYISYFYMGRCHVSIDNLKLPEYSLFWKVFAENNFVKTLAKKYEIVRGYNIVVSGYPKLDKLNTLSKTNKRKTIILSPHHSIGTSDNKIGAFLFFYMYFIEIVDKFPNIDFIFRPHPLLEFELKKLWGESKYKSWLYEFISRSNVILSTTGDYCELFAQSDALIHDCGSFSAEYLYTLKPCAFFFKPTAKYNKIHTELGHRCIDVHYLIKTKDDLINFIDNIVIKGNDLKQEDRKSFAEKELMINYPKSTEYILEYITKELRLSS